MTELPHNEIRTLETEPLIWMKLKANGYQPYRELIVQWNRAGNSRLTYKDWKALFDQGLFGDLAIRVKIKRSYQRNGTGKQIDSYDRYIKVTEAEQHLRRLLSL